MKQKKDWIVIIKCEVEKEICCQNCTEEEATNNPWDFAIDERELYQINWEVISVNENI